MRPTMKLAGIGALCLTIAAAAGEATEKNPEKGMSTNLISGLYRNWVRTTPEAENPGLRTRIYAASKNRIFERARALAEKRRGWKIIESNRKEGVLKIEARTRLLRFVDDVTIRVKAADGGGSLLDMESRSRLGLGDLGTNARRVGGFLKKLDEIVRSSGEM